MGERTLNSKDFECFRDCGIIGGNEPTEFCVQATLFCDLDYPRFPCELV